MWLNHIFMSLVSYESWILLSSAFSLWRHKQGSNVTRKGQRSHKSYLFKLSTFLNLFHMFIFLENKKTLKIVQLHSFRVHHDRLKIINYRFEIRRRQQWYFSGFCEKVELFVCDFLCLFLPYEYLGLPFITHDYNNIRTTCGRSNGA